MQRLIDAQADPNTQDRLGLTALMVASISGEAGCVRHLLKGGARRDVCEGHGHSALSLAQLHGSRFKTGGCPR